MEKINVHLFAGLTAYVGDSPLPPFPTEKSRSLFAYLAMHAGRPIYRDWICGLLWGDRPDPEARKALRTTLWRVRSVLEPTEADRGAVLRVHGDAVEFRRTPGVWVDVWEFEESLRGPLDRSVSLEDPDVLPLLMRAVTLYRGDLLEGIYDEWCDEPRQRLRLTWLALLERLMRYHELRKEWVCAIRWGRRILREEPLREPIHRALMEYHLERGDRPSAVRQYQECAATMDRELGISPMPETCRLFEVIRSGDVAPIRSAPSTVSTADGHTSDVAGLMGAVQDAMTDLRALLAQLENAQAELREPPASPPASPGGTRRIAQ